MPAEGADEVTGAESRAETPSPSLGAVTSAPGLSLSGSARTIPTTKLAAPKPATGSESDPATRSAVHSATGWATDSAVGSATGASVAPPASEFPGLPKLQLKPETEIIVGSFAPGLPPIAVSPVIEPEIHREPEIHGEPGIHGDSEVHGESEGVEPEGLVDAEPHATEATLEIDPDDFANGEADTPEAEGEGLVATAIGESTSVRVEEQADDLSFDSHRPMPDVPEVSNAEPARRVIDLDRNDEEEVKPANWFLAADAFGTKSSNGPEEAGGSPRPKKSKGLQPGDGSELPLGSGSHKSSAPFAVLALVVIALIGGFVKIAVLDKQADSTPPADLALRPTGLTCAVKAPVRSALRYERHQMVEESRSDAGVVETTRTRFVDNEAKNLIERTGQATFETEMLVDGRHFVASEPEKWSEVPLTPEQIQMLVALPFADRFTEATWLNDSVVSGVATCVYSALLGRVTLPDGHRISNTQLELYVDSSSQYRRVRIRGVRLTDGPTVAETTALPVGAEVGDSTPSAAIETYVLTIDIDSAPPFVPNLPIPPNPSA